MGDGEMSCVGQGGPSRVGRTQPPTQASPVTSSVTLQVSDNVGPPSLIPGMCQPCMEQLQALPHAPGDRCGVTCWNLLLPGGILGRGELAQSRQHCQGGRALVGALM